MKIEICDSAQIASLRVARKFNDFVKKNQNAVLGLATGNSVIQIYREMINLYNSENTSYSGIKIFNLDEYIGYIGNEPQSFKSFMQFTLFSGLNIKPANCYIPDGTGNDSHNCTAYDKLLHTYGPVDIQLLGVGHNGHIGFNEPGTAETSKTRVQRLSIETLQANSSSFSSFDDVPKNAITMGISSILRAKKIILVCFGKSKAEIAKYIFKNASNKTYDIYHPVSAIFSHPNVEIYFDRKAAEYAQTMF